MLETLGHLIGNPFVILFGALIGLSAIVAFIEKLITDSKATPKQKDNQN